MEIYLKIRNHSFYMIKSKEAIAINTERNSIKKLASLPSAYMEDVEVITKEEFENVKSKMLQGL